MFPNITLKIILPSIKYFLSLDFCRLSKVKLLYLLKQKIPINIMKLTISIRIFEYYKRNYETYFTLTFLVPTRWKSPSLISLSSITYLPDAV